MQRSNEDVGVIQVFKLRIVNHYNTKPIVPLLFLATLSKGGKPTYIKYQDLKQSYPQILINFLEKKLQIITNSQQLLATKAQNLILSQQQITQKSILINSAKQQSIIDQLNSEDNKRDQSSRSQSQSQSSKSSQSDRYLKKQSQRSIQPRISPRPMRSCRLKQQPSLQKVISVKRLCQQNRTKSKQPSKKDLSKQISQKQTEKHLDYDEIAIQLYGEADYLFKYLPVLFVPKKKKAKSRRKGNKSMSFEKKRKKKGTK